MYFNYSSVCMYVCECATITLKQNVQYIARIRVMNYKLKSIHGC